MSTVKNNEPENQNLPTQKSKSDLLRKRRSGTVINTESKLQEADLQTVVQDVFQKLKKDFPNLNFQYEKRVMLKEILEDNSLDYEVEANIRSTSFLKPDGGFVYLMDKNEKKYPILISEVKKQGTNDVRATEGKPKQSQGNAIERLGKNVLGFKVFLGQEEIFPFVCFCYGKDFEEGSSIRDRVATIASFAKLNTIHVHDSSITKTKIGSYFVRYKKWTHEEMVRICDTISTDSVHYYLKKYGKDLF